MNAPALRFKEFTDEWSQSLIGDVTEVTSSKRVYLSDYVSSGIPFYRGKEISELERGEQPKDILFISRAQFQAYKDKFGSPQKGDLLITAVGTIGNVYRVKGNEDFYFKDGNIIWLRNPHGNTEFLKICLERNVQSIKDSSIGSSQKALTIVELKKIKFFSPTEHEQQKIASFLSKIDQKVSLLSKKHELLVQYKKGVMQKIFSQEIRFKDTVGKNFPEWKIEKISSISSLITKGTTPTSIGCQFTKSGINFIKVESLAANGDFIPNKFAHIDEDCHKKLARSQLEKNDILFSIAGAIGRIAIVKEELLPANTNQALALIRISNEIRLSPQFLFHVLSSESIQKYAIDSTSQLAQANLSLGDLGCIEIPIPSLEEQVKITDFLLFVAKKVEIVNAQLELTKKYKQGLLQQMFI